MKRREVGRDFTRRIERYLERPDGSLVALFCEHWSRETDPAGIAREAAAWLRSRGLPDRPTADCSLCERLRPDHGARHDWPEDLAARIIDLVVVLEKIESRGKDWFNAEVPGEAGVHPSLERLRTRYWFAAGVAVELGVVYALFSIYRQLDDTRKKGRQPKLKPGTLAACVNLVNSNPEISNNEAWIAFDDTRIAGEDIYRDGDRLVEVDRSGREQSISRRTFDRYMTVARSLCSALRL